MLPNRVSDKHLAYFRTAIKFKPKILHEGDFPTEQSTPCQPQHIKNIAIRKYSQLPRKQLKSISQFDRRMSIKSNSLGKKKIQNQERQIDMIIPSLEAFDYRSIQSQKMEKEQKSRAKSLSKRSPKFVRNFTQKEQFKEKSKLNIDPQIKVVSTILQFEIQWNKKSRIIQPKQKYYSERENHQQFIVRRKNVQSIIRRKNFMKFSEMMAEYCTRMKISETSKIFVFESTDIWMKQLLIEKGWVINPDVSSKLFHFRWTRKIQDKANPSQLINHFYDSDLITSKQGLAKVVKRSKFLSNHSPRSHELGGQMAEFISDFKTTRILCQLKNIVKQIQNQNICSQQIIAENQLRKTLSQLLSQQNYIQLPENTNIYGIKLLIRETIEILIFCQNFRNSLTADSDSNKISLDETDLSELHSLIEQNQQHFYQSSSYQTPSQKLIQLLYSYHKYFCEHLSNYQAEGTHNIWIVKNRNSSKGIGIYLSDNLNEIIKRTENKLVQKYIENCYIYKSFVNNNEIGYKFDLRIWVLVRSFKPFKAYFYEQFYCRLCSSAYSLNSLSKLQSHLTNYSTNKQTFLVEKSKCILTYKDFIEMISKQLSINPEQLKQTVNLKLQKLIYNTLKQYKQEIVSYPECFQLYGFDILLTPPLNFYLLQVNLSPACKDRHSWLSQNVRKMAKGLINIICPQQFMDEECEGWRIIRQQ